MRHYYYWIYMLSLLSLSVGCEDDRTQKSEAEAELINDQMTTDYTINPSDLAIIDMDMNSHVNPCTTQWRYEPQLGNELYAFPDDFYRVPASSEDPSNQQRAFINITPQTAPWIAEISDLVQSNFSNFVQLDGYGLNTGIFLKFTAPIAIPPAHVDDSLTHDALWLVEISDAGDITRIPYQAQLGDEGRDLYLRPLIPLKEGTQHAVVMTKTYLDANGACIATAPSFQDMLQKNVQNESLKKLSDRLAVWMEKASLDPDHIVAVLQFTTHTEMQALYKVVEDIQTRTYTWETQPECVTENTWLRCQASFKAIDYRTSTINQEEAVENSWIIPLTLWLPEQRTQAVPVIVGGHGINSSRSQMNGLVRQMLPLGYAVMAADAVEHGDHPSRAADAVGLDALRILGIDLANQKLDIKALRENFTQTTLDRLQMIELIADAPDIDQDGVADLNTDQIGYFGISLGAMMGPSLIALSDRIGAAVLAVGGGDLLQFALGHPTIQPLLPLLAQLAGSRAQLDRLILTIQSLLDPADPNTFATRIFEPRLSGSSHAPNLLLFVSVFDEVVPPANAHSLARALQIPLVQPVINPIDLVEGLVDTPVSSNMPQQVTAGIFQMDRITEGDMITTANHDNAPYSTEAVAQWTEFFETWRQSGVSTIIDPYRELETPPYVE